MIYVCEHNEQGALGLVINRPTDLSLVELLSRIEVDVENRADLAATSVYFGGPVQTDRGFVLHDSDKTYTSSLGVGDLTLTTSRDVLQDVAQGRGQCICWLRWAMPGGGAGQLESEMADNAWLSIKATHEILFSTPVGERYDRALALLGISPFTLTGAAGHA
ncbi:YqgE/AlgH family protein [Alcaligenes faecalis]|uniref:YqgE/AlgH family protein n=1 Tax=Alcaligenes faecalis TaxID=511 RepID=UPI0020A6152B|nr:YqgE/AlgH family protein [Alcaligenes faecalis]